MPFGWKILIQRRDPNVPATRPFLLELIDTGSGTATDQGKVPLLNSVGKIDTNMLPSGGRNYDLGGTYNGGMASGITILRFPFPTAVVFSAGLVKSQGTTGVAPTLDAVFSLKKNGVQFGTMTFQAGHTQAVFASASDASFAIADVLIVTAPNPQDATLADIGFVLSGTVPA